MSQITYHHLANTSEMENLIALSKKNILAYRYYFMVTGTYLNFDGYTWQGRASLGTSYLRDVII